jgi:hypothetical protein
MPVRAGGAVRQRPSEQGRHMITRLVFFGSVSVLGIDGASDD